MLVPSITVGTGRGAGALWTQQPDPAHPHWERQRTAKHCFVCWCSAAALRKLRFERGGCRMNSHPRHGKGGIVVSGCFCSCCCPAVALVAVSVCKSVQLMPGTLLGFGLVFFCISSCKRDVRKTICSPKISSGADLLCFLYQIGSA